MTPEGRFADARDHDAAIMPGLSHLCHRQTSGSAVAMAIEYVFWDERLPVCLARFSDPVSLRDHPEWTKAQWNDQLTRLMRDNQAQLAKVAIARQSEPLDILLEGKTGAGGTYDVMRRASSWIKGERFRGQHGNQFR
jgi:hypothetical protein